MTNKKNQNDSGGHDCRIGEVASERPCAVISRTRSSPSHDVRIVIRPIKKGCQEAVALLIDRWLAGELARQIARDLSTTKESTRDPMYRRRN